MDSALLHILSEPRRLQILRLVWNGERSAGDIARHFELSRPAISQHLRVLREAGVIHHRQEGTKRFYRVEKRALSDLTDFLERLFERAANQISGLPRSSDPWVADVD